jgi:hypothetical protein
MWLSLKKRLKSKTYWKEIISGSLVLVEAHYGLLRDILGEHYGWSYLVVMLAGFFVRELTKKPIEEK